MAINSITGKNTPLVTTGSNTKKDTVEQATKKSPPARTEFDNFDATAVSQKIKQALTSNPSPVLNEEKINAVKEALQKGNYQINADSIAEKMLQFDNPFNNP